jgi:hypothetical protein
MSPNVRRDLVIGAAVVAFGLGLLSFALFAGDESFRAPRWVVAVAAIAFLVGGSIPLRHAAAAQDLRPSSSAANLVAAGILFFLALFVAWIMVAIGPEGTAVTLDIPLPFSEDTERTLKGDVFYGIAGIVALACLAAAVVAFKRGLPLLGRTALVAIAAPIAGLVAWVAIEFYQRDLRPMPPAMALSFDRRFPSDEYLSHPQGNEVLSRPGRIGMGLFVGGNGDYLDVEVPRGFDTSHGITLEFWMKRESWINPYLKGSKMQTVASVEVERERRGRPEVLQVGFSMELNAPRERPGTFDRRPETFNFRPQGRVGEVRLTPSSTLTIPALRWTHVAVVYDRFLIDRTLLYLDGKLVARSIPWGSGPGFADIRMMRIGTLSERNGAFRGTVDEVKVYARALSGAEIAASAARGS